MKSILTGLIFLLSMNELLKSQVNAVTENGDKVILYDNGTWKSAEVKTGWETRLDTLKFTKPASSTFQVKGVKLNYGVWLNPKKWHFKKEDSKDLPSEYKFTLIGQDAYAMTIAERIEMPLNSLKEIALSNAEKVAPDVRLIKEELRNINGHIVWLLQMEGTISGIKFVYYGYYYSDSDGTLQFITYTSKNLFEKYKPEMENLLNGFIKN